MRGKLCFGIFKFSFSHVEPPYVPYLTTGPVSNCEALDLQYRLGKTQPILQYSSATSRHYPSAVLAGSIKCQYWRSVRVDAHDTDAALHRVLLGATWGGS